MRSNCTVGKSPKVQKLRSLRTRTTAELVSWMQKWNCTRWQMCMCIMVMWTKNVGKNTTFPKKLPEIRDQIRKNYFASPSANLRLTRHVLTSSKMVSRKHPLLPAKDSCVSSILQVFHSRKYPPSFVFRDPDSFRITKVAFTSGSETGYANRKSSQKMLTAVRFKWSTLTIITRFPRTGKRTVPDFESDKR